ncbi:MAG: hypothetical protein JW885_07545 [Deltaproteobacteria bacterium]|nr:hypothetical protein [Candidatus Zymogenaceae bacterium]
MLVLGIHDAHNASVCLVDHGKIVFALQEERINRIKNYAGFPRESIRETMNYAGITPASIDLIVFSGTEYNQYMTNVTSKKLYAKRTGVIKTIRNVLGRVGLLQKIKRSILNRKLYTLRMANLKSLDLDNKPVEFIDHHMCHAAAAYHGMGIYNEDVLVLTCDGAGDVSSATVNIGRNGKIKKLFSMSPYESLGYIYSTVTYLMGMTPLEHEYKIMGMAPYSSEKYYSDLKRDFENILIHHSGPEPIWKRGSSIPRMFSGNKLFQKIIKQQRFDTIAGAIQSYFEDFLSEWVKKAIAYTNIHTVALGGGVFMNVKANMIISELPEVEKLFIYPSCGDETNSIGAALYAWGAHNDPEEIPPLGDFYLGPNFSDKDVEKKVETYSFESDISITRVENPEVAAARLLAEGQVVARFSGREEFGARALGNRSILADPKNPWVIRVINEMIKLRDFWMPFACSILEEDERTYLKNDAGIEAPYMIITFDTTDRFPEIIAGIHPQDFTVRPQIVHKKHNPAYHALISHFKSLTGRGAVLNTSFNLHGYPIVHYPEDAMYVFDNSEIQHLMINNVLISKKSIDTSTHFSKILDTYNSFKA